MITNRTFWLGAYVLSSGLLFAEADVTLPPPTKNETEPAVNWIRDGAHVDFGLVYIVPSLRLGCSTGLFRNEQSEPRALLDVGFSIPTIGIAPYVSLRLVTGRWTIGPEVGAVLSVLPVGVYAAARATYAFGAPSSNGSGWYLSLAAGPLYTIADKVVPMGSVSIGYSF